MVCQSWSDSFTQFLADMGRRPGPKFSIERSDVNKGYEPGNCKWLPRALQARNTRRSRHLTADGQTMLLVDWSRKLTVSAAALQYYVRKGKNFQEVVEHFRAKVPSRRNELFEYRGRRYTIADWSKKGGKETVEQIKEQGKEAVFVKTDVSKSSDINEMVKTCLDNFGRIDILVNNAGIHRTYNFHEMSEQNWDKIININLKSVFLGSKKVIPEMLRQGKGKIINTTSIAGLVGFAQSGAYCASKGGIIALTREMVLEYASKKINVNCIAPGVIKTAMTKDMIADPSTKKILESNIPYSRLGEPEDIAQAAVYLASDESDFVNGEILVVDGGWIAK